MVYHCAMTLSTPLADRFWAKVQRGAPDDCWLWQGATNRTGHGLIKPHRGATTTTTAHRVSWVLHNGPIPGRLYVLHDCDTPPCVNPTHLHLGTHRDNMREAGERGLLSTSERGKHRRKDVDLDTVHRMRAEGASQQVIAGALGVNQSTISDILRGQHWSTRVTA